MNGGRVFGVQEMTAKLRQFASKFPDRVGAALYAEAQIDMTESKRRCPVLPTPAQLRMLGRSVPRGVVSGALRASGLVSPPVRDGRRISVTLSYGGAAEAYAVVQHERLDFFHLIGQAKYLESVLNESRATMAGRIAARIHLNKTEAL